MKIRVDKSDFIKSWSLAERSAGTSSSMNIFSTVRIRAEEDRIELMATDIKTAVICAAKGVTVLEPGEAVIPLKGAADLFKKAGSETFDIEISDGRAVMQSGRSRYRFSTYPVSDFPKLPSSQSAELFCSAAASELMTAIERGAICASLGDEYPQYLSSAQFELNGGVLRVVSTDKRRLALAKCSTSEIGADCDPLLLPMKGLRELTRILGALPGDVPVKILFDDSQAYFTSEGIEFAVRRVESRFPPYEKIIPEAHTTQIIMKKQDLIDPLERIDIVVRDYNKVTIVNFVPDGESTLTGRAPEFGEAVEGIECTVSGEPHLAGYNTRYFMDAIKAIADQEIDMRIHSSDGHMVIRSSGSDSFICLIAPVDIGTAEEQYGAEADSDGGDAD